MIFIHVMLNDICLPCCHLPKTLFHDTPVYSVPDVPISTQIIATVWPTNYIDSIQNENISISRYRYQNHSCNYLWHINQFILLSLKIYCELQLHVQQFLHSWNFAVTHDIKTCNNFLQKNDLIWVMTYIYHTLTFTIIFSSSSLMHNFLHAKRLHNMIWHKTDIYFTYITMNTIRQ